MADPPTAGPTTLADTVPVLLGPVRLEYRFTATDLLVRIFPDDWAVDTFEEPLTVAEQGLGSTYWTRFWQAGGDPVAQLTAWRDLTSHVGPGRAAHIADVRRPRNPGDAPAKTASNQVILAVAGNGPLPVGDRAPAITYWTAMYRAGRDPGRRRAADAALNTAVNAATATRIRARRPDLAQEPATGDRGGAIVRVAFLNLPTPTAAGTRSAGWTQPARARLLPDRFTLLGWAGGRQVLNVDGSAVRNDLPVGPDPNTPDADQIRSVGTSLHVPDPLAWLVDFDAAIAAGMAFRIPLTDDVRGGLDRLIAIGLRVRAPETSRADLETLLNHQANSRAGLRVIPQGTPTNNTDRMPSAFGTEDEDAARLAALTAPPPVPADDWAAKSDGQWLSELLGIDPRVIAAVPGADGTDQAEARAMNTALWPATWGYHLGTMLNPLFGTAALDATRDFFVHYVSGRGPAPALRVGRQPYSVLVTTAFSRLSWADADPAAAHRRTLNSVLSVAVQDWNVLAQQVPVLGADGDPHDLLLGILGLHPTSAEFYQRYAQSVEDYWNRLNLDGHGPDVLDALRDLGLAQSVRNLLTRLGLPGSVSEPDALSRLFVGRQHPMRGPLVDDRPLSPTDPVRVWTDDGLNYLAWLDDNARADFDVVRLETGFTTDTPPVAILYLLLRHAVLNGYTEAALRLAATAHALTDADVVRERREPPFIHISESAPGSESRYQRLYSPDPAVTGQSQQLVASFITQTLGAGAETSALVEQLDALTLLAKVPTARLERVLVEHLDCATYRLDAWRLGLATEKLFALRYPAPGTKATTGVHVGAFGWLEEVRPRAVTPPEVTLTGELADVFSPPGASPLTQDPGNQGYVHAPSPAQASTAALLRAGYVANASPGNPDTLAVNLSSDRVRVALSFLDGIRNGQPLGALLGYRFERGLHDKHAIAETDRFIGALRQAFPLVAGKLPDTQAPDGTAIESVEASNVVDGLALVRHVSRGAPATYPFGLTGLPDPTTEDQREAIDAEVQALIQIQDALADLAVAEGVHQTVLGNPDRATAGMDAFTRSGFPPDPDVISTPSSGQRLNHRIGVHLRPGLNPKTSPVSGLAMTPAGSGDPAVASWLVGLLPKPSDVACRVTWTDPLTHAPGNRVVTQAELGLQPIDLLRTLRPTDQAGMTELDDRIAGRVQHAQTLRADTELLIRYTDPVPGKISLFQLSPLVDALRGMLVAARPARPSDFLAPAGGNPVDPDADTTLDLPRARPQAVRDQLDAFGTQLTGLVGTLTPLLADPVAHRPQLLRRVDGIITRYSDLMLTAGGLGLPRSGWSELVTWRRLRFGELLNLVRTGADRLTASLADADALVAQYDALPPTTPVEQRYAPLQQAERLLTTAPTSPRPGTPQQLRTVVTARRTAFVTRVTALTAIARTTRNTLSGLMSDVSALLPLTAFDPVGLDVTPTGDAIVALQADLLARATELRAEVAERLATVDQALSDYDSAEDGPARAAAATRAIRAALGPDALATSEFGIPLAVGDTWQATLKAGADGRLTQHLKRDFPVDDWLHGVARVRDHVAQWERITLLSGALRPGAEPALLPAQLPFRANEGWLALELPVVGWSHLNPDSGLENQADFSAARAGIEARFAVAGDFDGDGRAELAIAPNRGSTRGNDFWVMDYDPATRTWSHLGPEPAGYGDRGDFDSSVAKVPARFAVAGDVDGDGRDEAVLGIAGTNDLWVMRYDPATRAWSHRSPAYGLANDADVSAADSNLAARFAVMGDFDGDGRAEIAVAPDIAGTRGNDFWVLDYEPATGSWSHLGPAPNATGAAGDFDCSVTARAAKYAVVGDFDGDGRDEIAVAPDIAGTRGNDFWVMDYDPATRTWSHLGPVPHGYGEKGDFDCSTAHVAARFAVAGDFDGDGRDEVAVALNTGGTQGNDFWVMDYDPATGRWSHLSPTSGLDNNADFSSAQAALAARIGVVGDFDGDGRAEVAHAPDTGGSRANDFWVMGYDPAFRQWTHLGPVPRGDGARGDFDCSPTKFAPRFAVSGDFDGDGRDEVAIAQTAAGTRGNDFWVLDYDPSPRPVPGDRLLYTAHYGVPFDPHARQCALLIDEWTEMVPATTETTAVAAHYDRPGTQPPQTFLLVAPPEQTGTWSWDDLIAAIGETMDLIRLRAVEPTQIDTTPYAQLLPATVLPASARAITVTTDLALNNDTTIAAGPFRPSKG
jgi:hypothetical protein